MSQPVRILIADNDINFAQSLKRALEQQADLQVVNIARDGQGVVNSCQEMRPDVVLLDLHLPVLDSVKAIQRMVAQHDDLRILTMSALVNDHSALEAVKAGACGYIEKESPVDVMANTIRQVAGGEVCVNPALAASILEEFHRLGV
jgi:DNA-binding NarL/FixJ family response regulator